MLWSEVAKLIMDDSVQSANIVSAWFALREKDTIHSLTLSACEQIVMWFCARTRVWWCWFSPNLAATHTTSSGEGDRVNTQFNSSRC